MCKKYLLSTQIALLAFWIFPNITMGQPQIGSDFRLSFMFNGAHFYNIEKHENDVYIGSDKGIYKYLHPNKIALIDSTKKGYVYYINGGITCRNYFKIGYQTPFYNSLMPDGYKNQSIVGVSFKSQILITSNGKLFLFDKKLAKQADSLSVRSITNNYLGTYSGVFYKNKKIEYPPFCNGYIKEFDKETIICFDGIVRLFNDGNSEIYETPKDFQKAFGRANTGSFRDAIKIDDQNYILVTTSGLLYTNFKGRSSWIIKGNNDPNLCIIEVNFNKSNNRVTKLIFGFNNIIYQYQISSKSLKKLFEINTKNGSIKDIAYEELARVHVLTDDKLLLVQKHSDNTYTEEILLSNMIGNHQLIWLGNYLLITSNTGLSAINTLSGQVKKNVIQDEFNDKAYKITKDSIFLGTVSGYYALTNKQLTDLIETNEQNEIYEEIKTTQSPYFIHFIFTSILSILLIALLIYNYKRAKAKYKEIHIAVKITRDSLEDYIKQNLANATILSITEHFQTNLHVINKVLINLQLGELIRNLRIEKVKKMRKQNCSEQEISALTGFSISYLKKIKT